MVSTTVWRALLVKVYSVFNRAYPHLGSARERMPKERLPHSFWIVFACWCAQMCANVYKCTSHMLFSPSPRFVSFRMESSSTLHAYLYVCVFRSKAKKKMFYSEIGFQRIYKIFRIFTRCEVVGTGAATSVAVVVDGAVVCLFFCFSHSLALTAFAYIDAVIAMLPRCALSHVFTLPHILSARVRLYMRTYKYV